MSALRIVVTGLAITYPYGGVFWDYIQYPIGLLKLGHQVLYLEDTGQWCYDPGTQTFVEDGSRNVRSFRAALGGINPLLSPLWHYRDAAGATYGLDPQETSKFCRSADLFINLSGAALLRDTYMEARRRVLVDSDPMYSQASVPDYLTGDIDPAANIRIANMLAHDVYFTFAENIGAPDCTVPKEIFSWKPTRQPVVLDLFQHAAVPVTDRRPRLTTIASWEPSTEPLKVRGREYRGKSSEFLSFVDLPSRSLLPLEVALSGRPPTAFLLDHGWHLVDPLDVSADPHIYVAYLARSFGEWSVAKNAYVESRSGWFSCRTACYLALGVPAIVQDTGFGHAIPHGEGVLAFSTMDEAVDRIERLVAEPERHSLAALELARECFDSDRVLSKLIDEAFATDRSSRKVALS